MQGILSLCKWTCLVAWEPTSFAHSPQPENNLQIITMRSLPLRERVLILVALGSWCLWVQGDNLRTWVRCPRERFTSFYNSQKRRQCRGQVSERVSRAAPWCCAARRSPSRSRSALSRCSCAGTHPMPCKFNTP